MSSPASNGQSARRPSAAAARYPTAPSVMTTTIMNGHFASVGEHAARQQYEHGIQVINEDKEFKYARPSRFALDPS